MVPGRTMRYIGGLNRAARRPVATRGARIDEDCASVHSMEQPNNPLHGLTLEHIVVRLADHFGWDALADRIAINCFRHEPSVKSSLKFLRKTPWARAQVEELYVATFASR